MALNAQEIEQQIKEWVPMAQDIDLKVEAVSNGYARIRIPFHPKQPSNLNINFLKRPEQRDLIAEATILKLGKRIAFCEVGLRSEGSEELVAHVTGSYSLPPVGNSFP
jgi:acyl-coenzyme A thioesterase PaaI-like protein